MNTFKVAITGSHSTGKTTFAQALATALDAEGYRTAYISDLGEECRNAGFEILYDHTPQSTLWIMTTGISRELQAAITADVVIVDRPVPDALGYFRAALAYRQDRQPTQYWTEYLTSVARYHSADYDLIFSTQLDPTIPLGDGKPRDTDGRFRMLADRSIADVLADLEIEHFPLTADGHAEAIETTVERVIARLGAPPKPETVMVAAGTELL